MTRPALLVLDGTEIKLRLLAERQETKSVVHVDWFRFTALLRNRPAPSADVLFPLSGSVWDADYRKAQFDKVLASVDDCDFAASAQAHELAESVAVALGAEFSVALEIRKGHDYYKFRWSIERAGVECGWVGFQASGDSPRQAAQAKTIHANIYGAACTFASKGWRERLAVIVVASRALVTRCDLALDFFDGIEGGLDSVVAQYKSGECDSGGKRLKSSCLGDWMNNRSRSLYFGSKQAGKQTNVYEKGDQLYGEEANSKWLRVELRYGNKLRVLPVDLLTRPEDFFAGASSWHQSMLTLAEGQAVAEKVHCDVRRPIETVKAEAVRSLRWVRDVAAPSVALALGALGDDVFDLFMGQALPGRLKKFLRAEIGAVYGSAFSQIQSVGCAPAFG